MELPKLALPLARHPAQAIVVAYARYSSENQSEGSADAQIETIKRAIYEGRLRLHNPLLAGVPLFYAGHVKDEAVSGRKVKRDGIEMIERLISGKQVHAVVVLDLSRSTRLVKQTMAYYDLARFHGVEFVSLHEGTSSYSDASKPMFVVSGLVNELGNDQRRAATVTHMTVRASAGYSHGSLPYGYTSTATKVEDRKGKEVKSHFELQILPERAEVVVKIFQLYADGLGVKKIVTRLNAEQVPSPGQSHKREGCIGGWSQTTVAKMLKNARYAGIWHWKMTKVETDPQTGKQVQRPVPVEEWVAMGGDDGVREDLRIVPAELWERVQGRLAATGRKRAGGTTPAEQRWGNRKTSEADHMLSGLLACGACGANMILTSGRRGGYYGCYAAHRIGTCGNKRHVQLRKLENAIVGAVAEILDTPEMATEIANKCNAKLRKRLAEDPNSIERLRAEREKLERQIDKLVTFIAEEGGSAAVKVKLRENEARLATLHVQSMQLESVKREPVLFTPHAVQERLRGLVDLLRGEPTRARKVLENLTDGKLAVITQDGQTLIKGILRVQDGDVGRMARRSFEARLA